MFNMKLSNLSFPLLDMNLEFIISIFIFIRMIIKKGLFEGKQKGERNAT